MTNQLTDAIYNMIEEFSLKLLHQQMTEFGSAMDRSSVHP
jgi:hypothetical protein